MCSLNLATNELSQTPANKDRYSMHSPERIEEICEQLVSILKAHYSSPEQTNLLRFKGKSELIEAFSQTSAPKYGIGLNAALEKFSNDVLPSSMHSWNPRFLNHNFGSAPFPSVAGEMLASMMNTTLAIWEASPVATIIEKDVSAWMGDLLRMPKGTSGIFLPGGSLSNLFGLAVARTRALGPHCIEEGIGDTSNFVFLTSDQAHYSIEQSASVLGFGAKSVLKIPTNSRGEINVDDLQNKISECQSQGKVIVAVIATLGTTVTAGFDSLERIGPICKENRIHLHVDAAFGGLMALSTNGNKLFSGIEYADTVIWDAHKGLQVPVACSVLLSPKPEILRQTFATNADYLFHEHEGEEAPYSDLGQYTFLCGKRFESLKLWLLWQANGTEYFKRLADERLKLIGFISDFISSDMDFSLLCRAQAPSVCFRYLPSNLKDSSKQELNELHTWVREEAKRRGIAFFNIANTSEQLYFRIVFTNSLFNAPDFVSLIEDIRSLCKEFLSKRGIRGDL